MTQAFRSFVLSLSFVFCFGLAFYSPTPVMAAGCNLPASSGNSITDMVPSGAKLYSISSNQLISVNTDSNYVSNFNQLPNNARVMKKVGNTLYIGGITTEVWAVDVTTDTLVATISVGSLQSDAVVFGRKLYVSNEGSGNVSVINTDTNTVTATIPLGTSAEKMILVGTKIYVIDSTDNVVYAINALTDTLTTTIPIGNGASSLHAIGTKVYVTNSSSNTVSVINTNTNAVIATIPVGNSPVNAAVVGTKLYVNNSSDGTVSVINSATDTVVNTVVVAPNITKSYAVGTDIYIINGGDGDVRVYDTLTDSLSTTIVTNAGGGGNIIGAQIGSKIYLGTASGDISTIDTNTNTVISGCPQTYSVSASPWTSAVKGNKLYVNTLSNKVFVFNTDTGLQVAEITTGILPYSGSMYLNKYFVNNYADGTVSVIDTTTDTVSATITAGNGTYYSGIAGNKLYLANGGNDTVSIINADTNAVITTLSLAGGAAPFRIYSTATKVYVLNSGTNTVTVISVASNTVLTTITVQSSPDFGFFVGTELYVVSSTSGNVKVINTATDTVVRTITLGDMPNGGAVSGSKIFIANANDPSVSVINSGASVVATTIPVGGTAAYPTIAGGRLFVSNNGDETVSVIDPATNKVTSLLPVGTGPFTSSVIGNKIFVNNLNSNTVSIIDTDDFNFGDLQAPTLVEAAPIASLITDATPSYTFTSDEGGTIEYDGSCSSANTVASAGSNTITFDTLPDGTYADCMITTIDAYSNRSASLLLAPFTVQFTPDATPTPDPVASTPRVGSVTIGGGISSERIVGGRVIVLASIQSTPGTNQSVSQMPGSGNTLYLRDLSVGQTQDDVRRLQVYLNSVGFTIAKTGVGSPGKETNYFGALTKQALMRYQKTYGIKPASGFFGPVTRAFINKR